MGKIDRRLKRILGLARQAPPNRRETQRRLSWLGRCSSVGRTNRQQDSSRSRFRPALVLAGGAVALVLAGGLASCCGPALGRSRRSSRRKDRSARRVSRNWRMIVEQPPVWQGGRNSPLADRRFAPPRNQKTMNGKFKVTKKFF